MKEQFIKWAEDNNWDIVEVEDQAELPDHIKDRYTIPKNWYDFIAGDLGENAIIGIEPSFPSLYREMLKAKETRIIDYIDTMRLVKDESEIEAIRLACKWTDEGMKLLHEHLYRGESVIEATMYAKDIHEFPDCCLAGAEKFTAAQPAGSWQQNGRRADCPDEF